MPTHAMNDLTTAELIDAAHDALNAVKNTSEEHCSAFVAIEKVLERIPRITISLGNRVVINGVGAVVQKNWDSNKFYWAIGGVNPRDEHFDQFMQAFDALKQELSKRGLICFLTLAKD